MITSKHNEKLKLIRKLADRKHRDRHGAFVAEGEDLVEAAAAAGVDPEMVLVAGEDVAPDLLDEVSSLGSGSRAIGVYPRRWSAPAGPVCVYLHGVRDPGNVGAIVRLAHGLIDGTVVLGPDCADPFGPKAVRASMGSIFGQPVAQGGIEDTPAPRVALVAHGGRPLGEPSPPVTIALGAEREGLPEGVLAHCDERATIPLRSGGAESLNVAAAAAIVLHGISSPADMDMGDGTA